MVNANHARPLAAFWLLAIAAAVLTVVGLRADSDGNAGRPAPASQVTSHGAPELVLGGVLRGVPTLTGPSTPGAPASPAPIPGAATPPVQVSGPTAPAATHKARTNGPGPTTQAHASVTPAVSTATGHGKGRHKKDKAKSTATATPTGHGHGSSPPGRGKGH